MLKCLVAVILLFAAKPILAAPHQLFALHFQDVSSGPRTCKVVFFEEPPGAESVDRIVRESLEIARLIDSSRDILVAAFFDHVVLNSTQYSGSLVFRAEDQRVLTLEEYGGLSDLVPNTGDYLVMAHEDQTPAGVKPAKHWLDLSIVFDNMPPRETAYEAIVAEIRKAAIRNLDINTFVFVGAREEKASWRQIPDVDGAFIFGRYDSETHRVTRRGKVIYSLN